MVSSALVVGASGIVGSNLARHLRKRGWQVHGLARRPPTEIEGMLPIAADLLDLAALRLALQGVGPADVFITTWLRQKTEAENIRINRAMVRNVLDALSPSGSVKHVALVTGLKHYLGPFETYGKGTLPATPFSRRAATARPGEFLLRTGRRGVRRRRTRWLWMERASAAYDRWLRCW